jgi:hypothetical protein
LSQLPTTAYASTRIVGKKEKKKHKKKDLGQTGSTRDYYTMPEV